MCEVMEKYSEESNKRTEARTIVSLIDKLVETSHSSLEDACKALGKTLADYQNAKLML